MSCVIVLLVLSKISPSKITVQKLTLNTVWCFSGRGLQTSILLSCLNHTPLPPPPFCFPASELSHNVFHLCLGLVPLQCFRPLAHFAEGALFRCHLDQFKC